MQQRADRLSSEQQNEMENKKTKMSSSSSSSSSSSYLFNLLHEDFIIEDLIIEEILLKLPVSSLLRLRCVSRYFHSLITSPSFIKKHLHHSSAQLLISSRLPRPQVEKDEQEKEKHVFQHYACNFSTTTGDIDDDNLSGSQVEELHCPFDKSLGIHASCNGLLFLHKFFSSSEMKMDRGYIWNPCTKEYKEVLPPSRIQKHLFEGIQALEQPFGSCSGFCGFGYDCTKDEYKILYYEYRVGHLPLDPPDPDHLVSITEFKVYKLGTNTWTSISSHNNPCRGLFLGRLWNRIGLFTNGALHWIMSSSSQLSPTKNRLLSGAKNSFNICANGAKIISFCMEKEEFREIQKPYHSDQVQKPYFSATDQQEIDFRYGKEIDYRYGGLQELQGCLCICECPPRSFDKVDIWMLKDYAKDSSWTKLYTVMISKDWDWVYESYLGLMDLKLLRFCENGEIVITKDRYMDIVVYDPVKHISKPIENLNLDKAIREGWKYEVIYVKSLVSINSGTYMS